VDEHLEREEMSISEAEKIVEKAVDYLEEQIDRIDETPGRRNKTRRKYLTAIFMTLLAEKYRIVPPKKRKAKKQKS
jgi:hypothetical protein